MWKFIKSFFSFGLATTIDKLITFLLLPIYTRIFTKVDYAVIDLIQVILGVVSIFAVLQLETALQRYYYEYKGVVKKVYIATILIIIVSFSLVVTLLLIIYADKASFLFFKTNEYASLIKLAAWQLPLTNFSMVALVILRYEKKNVQFVFLVLTRVILSLAFIMILVVWQKQGLFGVFYARLWSFLFASIPLFFAIRKFLHFGFSKRLLKKAFKYALPQFPARIGSVLLTYANRFFMVGYLTLASIGIYSLSLKLASSIQLVYTAFIMAWAPFMFEQLKRPTHKETFRKVLLLVASPVFLLVSMISLFAKEIVLFVASEEFYESYHYVGGLSLFFTLLIFKEIVDIGPKFTEKTKYLSYTFFLSLVVNLLSLFFLIKYFGLQGVIYSMVITNTFLLAMSWFVSNKLYYIPYSVSKFILLAIPAYVLSIGSMYEYPNIYVRVAIFILVAILYGVTFIKYYSRFSGGKLLSLKRS